ncbi:MAG: hypothetical protein KAS78_04970 [Candidatus Pacebacteria bacterium]|nr:hypothetical protein [Candidatus Paceibacterota bacterium]
MSDLYKDEVIDPGDKASQMAKGICSQSFGNCKAIIMVPHQPRNFRGPVGFMWKPHILKEMMKCKIDLKSGEATSWTMLEEVQNDGAGGKPQFFTLVADQEIFRGLGHEIIAMTADDFARSGMLPAVIDNEINVKNITKENAPALQALFEGYGSALKESNLVNVTGEIAVMNHSITAFCDASSDRQLILTWGASCLGLAHKDLLIDNSKIKPGMVIVGFLENGYRCNGGTFFTNLILEKFGPSMQDILDDPDAIEFARKLTTPSISYAKTICRIIGWKLDGRVGKPLAQIAGIAHITGGGIWGKFGEILPQGVGADLDSMPEPPEVLLQAQEMSWNIPELRLTDHQAYGTFHGGCGMMIVVPTENDAEIIIREAAKDGIKAQIVGRTVKETLQMNKGQITIESRFKEGGTLMSKFD